MQVSEIVCHYRVRKRIPMQNLAGAKVNILIKYFGSLSKITGLHEELIEFEADPSIETLLAEISIRYRNVTEGDTFSKMDILIVHNGNFVSSTDFDKVVLED